MPEVTTRFAILKTNSATIMTQKTHVTLVFLVFVKLTLCAPYMISSKTFPGFENCIRQYKNNRFSFLYNST